MNFITEINIDDNVNEKGTGTVLRVSLVDGGYGVYMFLSEFAYYENHKLKIHSQSMCLAPKDYPLIQKNETKSSENDLVAQMLEQLQIQVNIESVELCGIDVAELTEAIKNGVMIEFEAEGDFRIFDPAGLVPSYKAERKPDGWTLFAREM